MSLLWLTNTVGMTATSLSSTAASSGYTGNDIIGGARLPLMRYDSATSQFAGYNCASQAVTHAVLAGAHYFKGSVNGTDVKVQYSTSHTTDSTTVVADMSLIGPKSQDWIKTISRTSDRFRMLFTSGSSQALLLSKVFFSSAFSFNNEPAIFGNYVWIQKGQGSKVKPFLGEQKYETELAFTLIYEGITLAKVQAFRALKLHLPLFLYDENGDLWNHKLEHVVLGEGYTEEKQSPNSYVLTIPFRRLRHYD